MRAACAEEDRFKRVNTRGNYFVYHITRLRQCLFLIVSLGYDFREIAGGHDTIAFLRRLEPDRIH